MVRPARPDDLLALQDVERAAGELLRALGMHAVADDAPPSTAELSAHLQAGGLLVSVDEDDRPVGHVVLVPLDGALHVEQLSVHPAHGRQGRGRALLDAAQDEAARRGLDGLTLTTFADVPWNAPLYGRLGFTVVADPSPGLVRLRQQEAARGLDAWPRVVMRRP